MSPAPSSSASPARPALLPQQAKERVAQLSFLTAAAMLAMKLAAGLHSRSLGILAEAAHSGLDLIATLLTWGSIRIAARPADANHPFGHGKFENFSAFFETCLLVLTAVAIGGTALHNWIAGRHGSVRVNVWAVGVMAISMAVDWNRARLLRRAAADYASDALEADALNFSSDLATSAAVLFGLVAVAAGQRWHWSWLAHADALAACVVALAMIWLAMRLGRRTAGVLLDEAPIGLVHDLRTALEGVEGVEDLERLRLRRVGRRYFVDLQLALEKASTLERARMVRDEIADRINRRLPEADVVVEAQPRRSAAQGPLEQVQSIALRHNLNIHDLSIYDLGSGLEVEFHLELNPALELAAAHDLVSRLEAEMRAEVPSIRQILTHIEPAAGHIDTANLVDPQRITRRVQQIAAQVPGILDCHDIRLRRTGGHLALSCHCTLPDDMPVERVHDLVTGLESRIKRALPELFRVTIHPEPGSDNRR